MHRKGVSGKKPRAPRRELSRYVFEHPEIEERLPDEAEIILVPEYDEELRQYNLSLANDLEATGTKVAYVRMERLRPKIFSRIEGLKLDLHAEPQG